ncbi:Metal dependent phosphohydrolase [Candidatus Magnetomorum sp. HK-1]|nr:Metal dependent phosphohydrolase [Candidatus Magnetomorum sp. HK-1]
MIPTIHQCFQAMEKYQMPEHIRAHSMLVARIARLIATNLYAIGINISIEKTVSGALMHDIAKISCVQTHEDHCLKGKEICDNEGFFEISDIVNEHVVIKHTIKEGDYNEKEIVNYADKRVLHDEIVSIQERLKDIIIRYGYKFPHIDENMLQKHYNICELIEKKLFEKLDFLPQDVPEYLKNISLL